MNQALSALFKTDITSIPDETFINLGSEVNSMGSDFSKYFKVLDTPELNIFDSVEVLQFADGSKNVFFIGNALSSIEFMDVANLVKDIYLIYGVDRNNKGLLEEEDVDYYFSDDMYVLFRRSWSDIDKHENPLELYVDRSENSIQLTIFAVR